MKPAIEDAQRTRNGHVPEADGTPAGSSGVSDTPKAKRKRSRAERNAAKQRRRHERSRASERRNPYAPMTGPEFLWLVKRAGIKHRHVAEAMGVSDRTIRRWGMLSAVPLKYVRKLQEMIGGRPMFSAARSEYRELMAAVFSGEGRIDVTELQR